MRLDVADQQTLRDAQELHERGDPSGAAALCRVILTETPDHPSALHLLGVIMSEVGLHGEALPILERAIARGSVEPTLLYNYGMTLRALDNLALAARAFRLAVNSNSTDVESWAALGTTRLALNQFEQAVAALQRAVDLDPTRADLRPNLALAQIGLGLAWQRARRFEDALKVLSEAIGNAPGNPQAHANLGNVLRDMGRFTEAQVALARALELAPNDAKVTANRALAYLHAGDFDAAIDTYVRAVDLAPGEEPIRSSLAQALLMAGRFADGWAEFEHRLADPAITRLLGGLPGERWRGEDIAGRRLIVRCEQGLGDTIQFARYVTILAATGATIHMIGPRRLQRLISGVPGLASYVPDDTPPPAADFHAPLLSVPYLLKARTIPAPDSYLAADAARIAHWAHCLGGAGKRRIGISWQGNPSYEMDYLRSVPAGHIAELIAGMNAHFIILQRGEIPTAIRDAGAADLGEDIDRDDAFTDTAAIIANLDLVITSDTAMAHLAGALGRPTWTLLPSAPDWRWRWAGADCAWYPTMRLIRQTAPGDWGSVVAQARRALASYLAAS
jgi:tetratricopeptide (TPR) repeat protein